MTRRRRAGKGDLYHIIGQTKPVTFLPPRTRGETGRFGARRKTRPKKRDRERERERVHTRYASGSRRQDRVAYSPGPSYNLGLTLCSQRVAHDAVEEQGLVFGGIATRSHLNRHSILHPHSFFLSSLSKLFFRIFPNWFLFAPVACTVYCIFPKNPTQFCYKSKNIHCDRNEFRETASETNRSRGGDSLPRVFVAQHVKKSATCPTT